MLYRRKLTAVEWLGTVVMLFGVLLVLNVNFGAETLHWYEGSFRHAEESEKDLLFSEQEILFMLLLCPFLRSN